MTLKIKKHTEKRMIEQQRGQQMEQGHQKHSDAAENDQKEEEDYLRKVRKLQ